VEALRIEVPLASIELDSELEALAIIELVPVIAVKTEEIGLVNVSTTSLPTVPGVVNVEVAAPHI
jgi:hypothetical protein